jgi:hypothetical protein
MREELIRDVMKQVGSIHLMNAPDSIGYLFNPNKGEYEIATGMYCSNYKEIDYNKWTYFFSFIDKHVSIPSEYKHIFYSFSHDKGRFYRLYPCQSTSDRDSRLYCGDKNDTCLELMPDDYKIAVL